MKKSFTLVFLVMVLGCVSGKKYQELEIQQWETQDQLNTATVKLNAVLDEKEKLQMQIHQLNNQDAALLNNVGDIATLSKHEAEKLERLLKNYKETEEMLSSSALGTNNFEVAEMPEELKLSDLDETDNDNLSNSFIGRVYLKDYPVESYRDTLSMLVGSLVVFTDYDNKLGSIGNRRFVHNPRETSIKIPKDGVNKTSRYTKNNVSKIGWLVQVNLSEKELAELLVQDVLRSTLNSENLDFLSLYNIYSEKKDIKNIYLVKGATVTKIYSRKFQEKGSRLNVSNFPTGGVALVFNNNFYTSSNDEITNYKVGLHLIPLQQILDEYRDKIQLSKAKEEN